MATYNETNYPSYFKKGDIINFNYSGIYKIITLPPGEYTFECYGAQGGSNASTGGYGAYTKGTLRLKSKQSFMIMVGQQGSVASGPNLAPAVFNNTATSICYSGYASTTGGGASDIRINTSITDWKNINSLRSRIMVAAAGGGGSYNGSVPGGTLTGYVPTGGNANAAYGGAGTQINGGAAAVRTGGNNMWSQATTAGTFGFGGNGTGNAGYGGGGAAGYYGGGGGADVGGSSGSSFISGYPGCNAINSSGTHTGQPNHYSGLIFTDYNMQAGIRSGNGFVKITVLSIGLSYFIYTNEPKYIQNGILYGFGRIPETITSADFDKYGMYQYLFEDEALKKKYPFYCRSDNAKLEYTFVPRDQLITNVNKIKLRTNIFISNISITGNSLYKIVINNGYNWYTFQNNKWIKIETLTASYASTNGITLSQLSSITEDSWKELYSVYSSTEDRYVNFGIILTQNDFVTIPYINKISITTKLISSNKKIHETNYSSKQDYNDYIITWNTGNKTKIQIIYK